MGNDAGVVFSGEAYIAAGYSFRFLGERHRVGKLWCVKVLRHPQPWHSTGKFEWHGVSVKLQREFHLIQAINDWPFGFNSHVYRVIRNPVVGL